MQSTYNTLVIITRKPILTFNVNISHGKKIQERCLQNMANSFIWIIKITKLLLPKGHRNGTYSSLQFLVHIKNIGK